MGYVTFTISMKRLNPYETDRHAKKELKSAGIRAIERSLNDADEETVVVAGYCQAVRSALTRRLSTLETPGLKLHEHLSAIKQSVERLAQGHCPNRSSS